MTRNLLLGGLSILTVLFLLVPGFTADPEKKSAPSTDLLKRGEYIVNTIGGCHDCHTPKNFGPKGPEPDMSRALQGYPSDAKLPEAPKGILGPDKWGFVGTNDLMAWLGPWGVSFAANLTPDEETGMGTWTEEMFMKAMRTGKHLGEGRDILPPMPWPAMSQCTDED